MRILTWNVNGIKTLLQYHPWNELKTYEGILDSLGADITCIQETKITRAQTDKSLAVMPKYDSFLSFYRRIPLRGIHGTAIFTKKATCVPIKAEEGIGDSLLPGSMSNRIEGYPEPEELDILEDAMKDLDMEGRTTVCDFGMFVLINLYCPNETNEHRLVFKNYFNKMVERRVRNLIKAGRQVIVVGDLNVCYHNIDTAEPDRRAKEEGRENFTDHEPRKWLRDMVGPSGLLIDITRRLHPTREGMFTCWNTKIDARPTNYGSRIDFVLVTSGLLPWVKDSDIQPSIMGSDHCPVYVDFHDQLDGVSLWDLINPGRTKGEDREPPAFAAKDWDEFSGKQKLLSSFFGKKAVVEAAASASPSANGSTASGSRESTPAISLASLSAPTPRSTLPSSAGSPAPSSSRGTTSKLARSPQYTAPSRSRSAAPASVSVKGKGKASAKDEIIVVEQPSISSFFKPPPKPKPLVPKAPAKKARATKAATTTAPSTSAPAPRPSPASEPAPALCHSSTYALDPAGDDFSILDWREGAAVANEPSAAAWTTLFKPKAAPKCKDHGETAKLWTVNKPGLNKGRRFYLCSRPVGPGYDKGQAKLHVNPEFRCNFFEWETSVKRPAAGVSTVSSKKQKT